LNLKYLQNFFNLHNKFGAGGRNYIAVQSWWNRGNVGMGFFRC